MKKLVVFFSVLAIICGLCACTPAALEAEITDTTIVVNSDGTVRAVYVEDFGQSYYSADELQSMVNKEISDFNNANGVDSLILNECIVNGNTARVDISYNSVSTYTAYEKKVLFVGTIAEAEKEGYDLNQTLHDRTNISTTIDVTQILEMQDKNIVIAEEAAKIRTYKKMKYLSADVTSVNEYEADARENIEYTFIIF